MSISTDRILYTGTQNASSWALRAWLALKEGGIPFEERLIDIRAPQRTANLARIGQFSPSRTVPALTEGELVIFDSLAIMEYANDLCGGLLLPEDARSRARCRSFLAWQHSGMSNICPKLSFESAFYPNRRSMTREEQIQAKRAFDAWEAQLIASGGPYLFKSLSLADIGFVPSVLRLSVHAPSLSAWPRVQMWAKTLLERSAVREWLNIAERLEPVWYDEYLA